MSKERIFHFKQFDVSHSSAAMKVGTDGVLLGAWAAISDDCRTIWDIGGGSGLIALMLAQRCDNVHIYSIEIDPDASHEMASNFRASKWDDRLEAVEGDIFNVSDSLPTPDLIISNPPFFTNSLSAPDHARAAARHEASLGFESLVKLAAERLSPNGQLAMISPADRSSEIEWFAALHKLCVVRRAEIVTRAGHRPSRILWLLSRRTQPSEFSEVFIRDIAGEYTEWYRMLTKDFYIHL